MLQTKNTNILLSTTTLLLQRGNISIESSTFEELSESVVPLLEIHSVSPEFLLFRL